jgi:hypothetical protein
MENIMLKHTMTRRGFSIGLLAVPALACSGFVQGALAQGSLPAMKVSKDPDCGCCGGWIDYLRKAGLTVDVTETKELDKVRARLGVPDDLASCHTAEIGGYVIEGHVPYPSIRKLLAEKPRAVGLSVPGMPQSSPGMDVPGSNNVYEVVLFGPEGRKKYAKFRGRREIGI